MCASAYANLSATDRRAQTDRSAESNHRADGGSNRCADCRPHHRAHYGANRCTHQGTDHGAYGCPNHGADKRGDRCAHQGRHCRFCGFDDCAYSRRHQGSRISISIRIGDAARYQGNADTARDRASIRG